MDIKTRRRKNDIKSCRLSDGYEEESSHFWQLDLIFLKTTLNIQPETVA